MRSKGRTHDTPRALRNSPPPHGVVVRLNYLRIVVAVAFACGVMLSPGLWFGWRRTFPRAPLFGSLPSVLLSADYLFSLLLLAALALAAAAKRPRRYMAAAVALTVALVVLDQTRLQPWVYQYLVMLMVLASMRDGAADATALPVLAANQLVLSTLYFWSGAQKLNWSFGHEVMPRLLEQAGINLPSAAVSYLPVVGVLVALCEMLIGVGLLIQRTRRVAVLLALSMHLLVLLMLIAAWRNSVVWVWNICMMVMVALLFWRMDNVLAWRVLLRSGASNASSRLIKVVLVVCALAPVLSFAGWWDMNLSGALYSGNTPVAVLRIGERVRERLPVAAQQQLFTTQRGELMLPFYEWSLVELNVPPYPEVRVFRQLAREVCGYAEEPQEIELIIRERPSLIDGSYNVKRATCQELDTR